MTVPNQTLDQRLAQARHGAAPDGRPEPMLRWFEYAHLPAHLRAVSECFADLATNIVMSVPASAERTVALRKLLESKDAAVRASLPSV